MDYSFTEIEPKWRRIWEESGAHHPDLAKPERKFYGLVMFSYPSAQKLHIGHWYNFGLADSYFRWQRMRGYHVFEPMGFDAFGLPAENFAVAQGVHPGVTTSESIRLIREQLKQIGAMYDWAREVNTSEPQYYKWTQWLFLTLFKMGLAYQKQAPVNWCPSCQTVLANEQAEGGHCERCGSAVVKRDLKQWFFRITEYADRLLEGLEHIDWPRKTNVMQENWIGRSEGSMISFPVAGRNEEIEVFTTRADTLFGVTYVVLAPEHPFVQQLTTPEQRAAVEAYIAEVKRETEIDRTSTEKEKTGVFTGAFATHPLNGKPLPIWIADYVLLSYGTGAVMAVPAHDQRDFEFAQAFKLPMRVVIQPPDQHEALEYKLMDHAYEAYGVMVHSGEFNSLSSEAGKSAVTRKLEQIGKGRFTTNYRLRDWLISRQRYWGAPIPIIHCPQCGTIPVPEEQLPVLLPENVRDFAPRGKSPLAAVPEFMNVACPQCDGAAQRDPDTMDTFVCSSWYFLRYLSPEREDVPFDPELVRNWLPVDQYIGGAEHAVMHLLYARFIYKALFDAGLVPNDEPFARLRHQGIITHKGAKMSKSLGNVVNPDDFLRDYGADVFRMYLMFMGDFEQGGDWSDEGIVGVNRFVNKLWRLFSEQEGKVNGEAALPTELNYVLHYTIQQVTQDLSELKFNTALSRMMELLSALQEAIAAELPLNLQPALDQFARILAPFAPHLGEELWHMLHPEKKPTESVFDQPWPGYDPKALVRGTYTLVVQVNGKLRERLEVPSDTDQAQALALAKTSERLQSLLEGKPIRKVIFVPGKLLNLVVG